MKSINKRLLVSLSFVICAIFIVVLASYFTVSKNNKRIVVGVARDYEPFSFLNDDQDLVGFDIDLIKAIAEGMDKKLEFKIMSVSELLGAVKKKRVDIALAGMPIEQIQESDLNYVPYSTMFISDFYCLMALKNRKPIDSKKLLSELVGVQDGTGAETYLSFLKESSASLGGVDVKSKTFNSKEALISAIRENVVESVILSHYQFQRVNAEEGKIFQCIPVSSDIIGESIRECGIIMRHNYPLRKDIDNAMNEITENGEYDILRMHWITG